MRQLFFIVSLSFSFLTTAFAQEKEAYNPSIQSQNIEKKVITINLKNAFNASPIIYSVLLGLSVASLSIAISAFFEINKKLSIPTHSLEKAKEKLISCRYDEAVDCLDQKTEAIAAMVICAIQSRKLGLMAVKEAVKNAGRRQTLASWQKLSLLSDIALLSPMIGLLGTVLGMFYAFYDVNRSIESLASLFDGLGVSVGTTVAGLFVALASMVFQTLLKHKLISGSHKVEVACETVSNYIGPT
jgi:biopolymer transport protein ExbB/TolQ